MTVSINIKVHGAVRHAPSVLALAMIFPINFCIELTLYNFLGTVSTLLMVVPWRYANAKPFHSKPKCLLTQGPICATDGKQYSTVCTFLKARKRNPHLEMDHYGACISEASIIVKSQFAPKKMWAE